MGIASRGASRQRKSIGLNYVAFFQESSASRVRIEKEVYFNYCSGLFWRRVLAVVVRKNK